jgi:plasmid maintenance system antidote protein VapI
MDFDCILCGDCLRLDPHPLASWQNQQASLSTRMLKRRLHKNFDQSIDFDLAFQFAIELGVRRTDASDRDSDIEFARGWVLRIEIETCIMFGRTLLPGLRRC